MSGTRPSAVVADDSQFMRNVIADMLAGGDIEVVAEAADGREAVEAVGKHRPDVVTMDVEMPRMDGIEAVERIMAEHPTPVLMLSAHTDDGADVTFEALEKGAVDFFTKPGGELSVELSRFEDRLVDRVRSVAEADVGSEVGPAQRVESSGRYARNPTVVIGSSTGGPPAVERVLAELPPDADCRVLIVQHMPGGFTGRFADRLDDRSDYRVREADDGDRIGGGEALVATGDRHMAVSNYAGGRVRVRLTDDPPENSVRPAVDVTMRTAADRIDDPLVGVVLTGMGGDGAAGIEAIHRAGGHTIAQDESTSAVFGMPKRAIETGCVDAVYGIDDITRGVLEAITEEEP